MQKSPKRRKKLEVRKGPTTRSHCSVLEEVIPDFIPSADEEDDWLLFEDDDDGHEPRSFVLPKGRKSRAKKRKPRIWYNDKLEHPHQQLCLYMCFKDQHQFREALLSLHITQARDFRYHRNSDQRIIACCKQDHCQFCIVAAVIKGEKTFAIKKMRLEQTCPTNTEKSRISAKWLAKTYESLFRSDPSTSINTLMDKCRENYGVDVGRHVAYRAKNLVVEAMLGEHKKQYPRLGDYAQTIMDTNPGSRVVVTTVTSKPTTKIPHPAPRKWDLSGIPCNHAISAINKAKRFLEEYVSKFFKKSFYLASYEPMIYLLPGEHDWTRTSGPDIEPPTFHVKRGRKKENRIKGKFEVPKPKDSSRIATITCSNYGFQGHSYTNCRQQLRAELAMRKNKHVARTGTSQPPTARSQPAAARPRREARSQPPPARSTRRSTSSASVHRTFTTPRFAGGGSSSIDAGSSSPPAPRFAAGASSSAPGGSSASPTPRNYSGWMAFFTASGNHD
ncbi:hypothetical protein D1007_21438 [Hordeum vulgare]|nr:hypothetical protein D1007_21438 [Hordeum vulgare]